MEERGLSIFWIGLPTMKFILSPIQSERTYSIDITSMLRRQYETIYFSCDNHTPHRNADYAKMNYFAFCHTEISKWSANRYQRMLESGESTVSYTPNYKLEKQAIEGGTSLCTIDLSPHIY